MGYEKNSIEGNNSGNSRNGYRKKTINSDYGECEISIPRDRNGEFEPKVIEKRQTRTDEIEQKIMAMYAKGMSQRDIEDTIREIYGVEDSQTLISRKDNRIVNKCVYSVLGINMEGRKEIGTWISENESTSFYASICADLKKRGVEDIFVACHNNLTGLCEAINSIFPKTKNQLCIVRQIRNSCKFVPYKNRKAVCAELENIYGAISLDDAEFAKEEFREKWDKNLAKITVFFEYPADIRKIIYTTNAVESYHRAVRKFTKSKSIFPTDDSIRKVIYLSAKEISKKWTIPIHDWGLAYAQLSIYFEDRFAA